MHYAEMAGIQGATYMYPVAWAARPDIESRALLVPENWIEDEIITIATRRPLKQGSKDSRNGYSLWSAANDASVDVFYIHPTAYWGKNWNANYDDPKSVALIEGQALAMDVTAFNKCCRIFAPRYRQAHGVSMDQSTADGRQALDLATVDIERAFRHYAVMEQNGRPVIIVGHGQGALLAMRLLDRRIDNENAHFKNFVAAYLIGAGVPLERFGTNWEKIEICESATDLQCVVAWEAYTENTDAAADPNILELWYDRHWTFPSESETLCTNPVTWKIDGHAAVADNLPQSLLMYPGFRPSRGLTRTPRSYPPEFDILPTLAPGFSSATCRDGILYVDLPDDSPVRGFGPGNGNLDQYAIALFWASIRENAAARAAAFLEMRAGG